MLHNFSLLNGSLGGVGGLFAMLFNRGGSYVKNMVDFCISVSVIIQLLMLKFRVKIGARLHEPVLPGAHGHQLVALCCSFRTLGGWGGGCCTGLFVFWADTTWAASMPCNWIIRTPTRSWCSPAAKHRKTRPWGSSERRKSSSSLCRYRPCWFKLSRSHLIWIPLVTRTPPPKNTQPPFALRMY